MKTTATAATLAYVERVLRYLALLRYCFDRVEKLLAFVSRPEKQVQIYRFGVHEVAKQNNKDYLYTY